MKLNKQELEAVCEYVDGRREAGASYEAIADELRPYTVPLTRGGEPRLTEADLDDIERLHRRWKTRQLYLERQRATGDGRSGTLVPEVAVDWQAADHVKVETVPVAAPSLFERAEALHVVMYLKRSLLSAEWRWVSYKTRTLTPGLEWRQHEGPGKLTLPDGKEAEWLWGAVVLSRDGVVQEVFEECRKRSVKPSGWHGCLHPALEMERRELSGEAINAKDLSARLATLLHTCLGGKRSPFRNNEHLAQLLGVTREAMRVRKKRIMKEAGMRSAEGQVPERAKGGRAGVEKRKLLAAFVSVAAAVLAAVPVMPRALPERCEPRRRMFSLSRGEWLE